ncbi:hypothetical protein K438DRAFT_1753127 [Mycena galopus ATCC 62051]|nr:hypothetical protein K438DRAFT_1753127 [Mycena galopus ATCC 62051]
MPAEHGSCIQSPSVNREVVYIVRVRMYSESGQDGRDIHGRARVVAVRKSMEKSNGHAPGGIVENVAFVACAGGFCGGGIVVKGSDNRRESRNVAKLRAVKAARQRCCLRAAVERLVSAIAGFERDPLARMGVILPDIMGANVAMKSSKEWVFGGFARMVMKFAFTVAVGNWIIVRPRPADVATREFNAWE